jgi:antitoxin component YwqK of YwqJK toxin-antitoxin module
MKTAARIHLICIILLAILTGVYGSDEPQVWYFGSNDRPATEKTAIKKLVLEKTPRNKKWLYTHLKIDDDWKVVKKEIFRETRPLHYTVQLYEGKLLMHKTRLTFEKIGDETYLFEERRDGRITRTGNSSSRIPLHLEGMVKEYYDNGNLKSESMYADNQLVWNRNWLRDGSKFIDSLFYSVDRWPVYINGDLVLKTTLNNHIVESKHYSNDLSGTVLLGFVIMETGEIQGVHVMNYPVTKIAEVAAEGLQMLPGKWEPAVLDNKTVRCFMTFPINFINRNAMMFNEVEMVGNMIFYNYR